jgi:predicted metal-dependent phosphoesterase TrpH
MIDLHFHSHYSDGIYSPKELVARASQFGFKVLSLTDHDVVAGIEEIQSEGKSLGIKLISGIEFYSNYRGKHLHILGYNFDFKNKKLLTTLEEVQARHKEQVKVCGQKLGEMGFIIDIEKIFASPSKYVGLGHFIGQLRDNEKNWQKVTREMEIQEGEIVTLPEIVRFYFYPKEGPLLLEAELPADEVISLIKDAGGIAILAHPGQHLSWHDEAIIKELKNMGIVGLEAISSHHDWAGMEHWQKLAKKYKLLITCGSDYHGDLPREWGFPLDSLHQYFKFSKETVKEFLELI